MAIPRFSKSKFLEAPNKELYYYRAISYSNAGTLNEVTPAFVSSARKAPSPMEFVALSFLIHENLKYIGFAINDLTKAIELDEEYIEAYKHRALMYFFKGDLQASLADAKKSNELGSPLNPQALGAVTGAALSAGIITPEELFGEPRTK